MAGRPRHLARPVIPFTACPPDCGVTTHGRPFGRSWRHAGRPPRGWTQCGYCMGLRYKPWWTAPPLASE